MSVSVCPNGHIYSSSECGICAPKKEPDPGWTGLPDDAPFGQEESDYTPKAFSPPTTDGDTNLTQPSVGEQPTSVEREKLITSLRNSPAFNKAVGLYPDPTNLVDWLMEKLAEERRQAKIELAEKLNALPDVPMTKGSHVSAIFRTAITNELTELRGENNE